MAQPDKLARQQIRHSFDPACAREKMMGPQENFHARNHAPTNSRKEGRERILPARSFRKTPSL
jgi:hypothetical protein